MRAHAIGLLNNPRQIVLNDLFPLRGDLDNLTTPIFGGDSGA